MKEILSNPQVHDALIVFVMALLGAAIRYVEKQSMKKKTK